MLFGMWIMKILFTMLSYNTIITLLKFPRTCRKTSSTIFLQHTKVFIIQVCKFRISYDTWWKCTFIIIRILWEVLCMSRVSLNIQKSLFFNPCHENWAIWFFSDLNISIKHMNGMSFLVDVYKRYKMYPHLWEI